MALRVTTVRNTPDLQRIVSLPRRTLRKSKAKEHAAYWTERLALRRGAELRPWQGQLLHDAKRVGGALAGLPVGQGKTLPAELLPVVYESERAVLIVPAGLREKTWHDRRSFAGSWRTASPPPRLISREELALDGNEYLLSTINPDLIIIDEAHRLSNFKAAAPRRIDRFIREKRKRGGFGAVRVVAMTGTLTRKSILGYWHLLVWCLGEMAPVPLSRAEAEAWALALDEGSPRAGFRPKPGALGATIDEARAWYLDRLDRTPGVLLIDEDSAEGIPLTVEIKPAAVDCADIDAAFDRLLTFWESPSREPVSDALSMMRMQEQLGCGYYSYWKLPPPEEWIEARQKIAAFIRKRIAETSHAHKPLDTDAQVIRRHPEHPAVREWQRVKGKFNPRRSSRVKWFSDAAVKHAARWIRRHEKAGRVCVVWTHGVEFGKRIAELAGVPYYGCEGLDPKTKRSLHAADVRRSMVCSWQANMQGFNLQAWAHQAIYQPPPSSQYLEQIIGRAHRANQTHAVKVTIMATSGGTIDAVRAAFREARFAKGTTKSTQKILKAEIIWPEETPDGLRWVTKHVDD